jgi:hypothetical protein
MICYICYYVVVVHRVHFQHLAKEIRKQMKIITVKYCHYLSKVLLKTSVV